MSVTSAPFYHEPARLRPVRFIALLFLALALTLISGLALLSTFPILHAAIATFNAWSGSTQVAPFAAGLTVTFIVLVPVSLLLAMWRFKLRSWWWVGGGWIAMAPVLTYLAIDEPATREAIRLEEISPAFPGAEKSYEFIMRYGKNHPAAQTFKPRPAIEGGFPDPVERPEKWRDFVLQHRAVFESEWVGLAPERAWWAELNAFDRIGDLSPAGIDPEVLSFPIFRTISQRAWAVASLQALDGDGDAAIATLVPILEVARKMQPSARNLVRLMMGLVIERGTIRTVGWILDRAVVSPATRARLAQALGQAQGEIGARRIVTLDYAVSTDSVVNLSLGEIIRVPQWTRRAVNLVGPFLYNPRATMNLYSEHVVVMQDLAARRALNQLAPQAAEFFADRARPRFKNFMGPILLNGMLPSYSKMLETYWKNEDAHAALLARLHPSGGQETSPRVSNVTPRP